MKSTVSDPVYFEERQLSIYDDQAIRLKAKQSEEQTIADLVACILEKEKRSDDEFIRFENDSIASVVMTVFWFKSFAAQFADPYKFEIIKKWESEIATIIYGCHCQK